jgi:PilZ domain
VSEGGACLWTNSQLPTGGRLVLRVSLGHPAEVHELAVRVVWTREREDPLGGVPMRRYGLQWQDSSSAYVVRLLQLAREASGEKRTGSRSTPKPHPGLDVRGPGPRVSLC